MISLTSFDRCYGRYLPKLGGSGKQEDPIVYCKFFDQAGEREWYVLEGEKLSDTYRLYGYVVDNEGKMGEFTLKDLELERTVVLSLFFKACHFSSLKRQSGTDILKSSGAHFSS